MFFKHLGHKFVLSLQLTSNCLSLGSYLSCLKRLKRIYICGFSDDIFETKQEQNCSIPLVSVSHFSVYLSKAIKSVLNLSLVCLFNLSHFYGDLLLALRFLGESNDLKTSFSQKKLCSVTEVNQC